MCNEDFFKTSRGAELEIRLANVSDIPFILSLNRIWTISSLDKTDKKDGFLFCEMHNKEELEKIINHKELGIAAYNGNLVAYFINDNYSSLISEYQSAIQEMKNAGLIHVDHNYVKERKLW
ncbi:MAG: hypothetical protein WC623_07820 [Pedobacter sp.]|uniref:hypothetical protein n=1 Tax=Pedobacter sp. TaxID=1411316 RepID=UPI0035651CB8